MTPAPDRGAWSCCGRAPPIFVVCVMVPETRYARSGNLHIAYQVVGDGPVDLVFVHGWISHVEHLWEEPSLARFLTRLASFSRLILLDKRGTGLSDPVPSTSYPHSKKGWMTYAL